MEVHNPTKPHKSNEMVCSFSLLNLLKLLHRIFQDLSENNDWFDLPEVGEPFDQLGSVVFIKFDIWEVHLEYS